MTSTAPHKTPDDTPSHNTSHAADSVAADSVVAEEVGYFDSLAGQWWNPSGPFAALQRMTPARVAYICRHAARLLPHLLATGQDEGTSNPARNPASNPMGRPANNPIGRPAGHHHPLKGVRVLDIGCGGGLLAEPLARLGGVVTGIDAGSEAIAAARRHAEASGLDIDYQAITAESLAETGVRFDIIIASEVIEHVADMPGFLTTMARFGAGGDDSDGSDSNGGDSGEGAPSEGGSMVVVTTINRSLPGIMLGKYAAEYLLRLAPRGAHDPRRFVRPDELQAAARRAGIEIDDITGIQPSILGGMPPINFRLGDFRLGSFRLGGPPLINYAAAGRIR